MPTGLLHGGHKSPAPRDRGSLPSHRIFFHLEMQMRAIKAKPLFDGLPEVPRRHRTPKVPLEAGRGTALAPSRSSALRSPLRTTLLYPPLETPVAALTS